MHGLTNRDIGLLAQILDMRRRQMAMEERARAARREAARFSREYRNW